ncbi:unnamed protein product [Diplocarpon coronariae]
MHLFDHLTCRGTNKSLQISVAKVGKNPLDSFDTFFSVMSSGGRPPSAWPAGRRAAARAAAHYPHPPSHLSAASLLPGPRPARPSPLPQNENPTDSSP